MEKELFFNFLLFATFFFWLKENIIALFNYNKRDIVETNILDFVPPLGWGREYFDVVEISNIKYIIRRGMCDKVGKTIKVFPTCKYNNYYKMPICHRANFVFVYVDFVHILYFIGVIPCLIYYITVYR